MLDLCIIGFHIATSHFGSNIQVGQKLNGVNPGAYVSCPNGLTVGTLYNSYRRQSFYVGHTWERGPFSVTLGGISGYPAAPVLPFTSAGLRVKVSEQAAWRLSFLPRAPKVGTSAAVHLSLELTGSLR